MITSKPFNTRSIFRLVSCAATTMVVLFAASTISRAQTPSATVTILHSFLYGVDATDALYPSCTLIQASNGVFYGATENGGSTGQGAVFAMTAAGAVTILHTFGDGSVPDDGKFPAAGLVQGSDGNLYGTARYGGAEGLGTAYRISSAGKLTILHSFGDGSTSYDGRYPFAALIQGSDGNFYGTTCGGGSVGCGTTFSMSPGGVVTILHCFGDGSVAGDGVSPLAGLVQAPTGTFYGTTNMGGSANFGTAFSMTTSGKVTILHSFNDGSVPNDGELPSAALALGSDGNLYGTTQTGGSANCGAAFAMTTAGSVTILHSFFDGSVTNDGRFPYGTLVQGSDGLFYGTTWAGGSITNGTVFSITAAGTECVLHSFRDGSALNDGALPESSLVLASDGELYGTTTSGGASGNGTAFRMSSADTITVLHSFGDNNLVIDGLGPEGSLVEGSDGNFYGTTDFGGSADSGTVFCMTPAGVVSILHSFGDGSVADDGEIPNGLVQGSNGSLYGTTWFGGSTGTGTAFKLTLISAAPTITVVSPAVGPVGSCVTITGTNLSGATNVAFGGVPATSFVSDGASQIVAVVPSGAISGAITVTTAGGAAMSPTGFTVAPPLHNFAAGLIMISAPVDDSGFTLDRQFDQSGVPLAVWDPTTSAYVVSPLPPADTIHPGQGYWARFAASTNLLEVGALCPLTAPVSTSLAPGWNMIGVPRTTSVVASSITVQVAGQNYGLAAASAAGLISNDLFTYQVGDTGYEAMLGSDATLQPYCGYWLYAYRPCTLTFAVP